MLTKKSPKIPKNYLCDCCDYITSNKKDYTKHLLTAKHKKANNANDVSIKIYECNCGRIYKHLSSYSRHKKKCFSEYEKDSVTKNPQKNNPKENNAENINSDAFLELLKQRRNQKVQKVPDINVYVVCLLIVERHYGDIKKYVLSKKSQVPNMNLFNKQLHQN